jgi:GcvH upstream region-like protein
MLNFFRKYQWYFFLVITIAIVISFSFFGTYNSLSSNSWREQVGFKAVNGKEVTRAELDDMVNFIATDSDEKAIYGGSWGLNFFNDGVIPKNFLQTGLAEELIAVYGNDLKGELQQKLARERKYKLYQHPEAKFLSVENTWGYFSPEMNTHFNSLQSSNDAMDPNAFRARVNLYLGQKKIPDPTLRQILRYQESQYNWLTPDANLDRTDLSLFGYHTVEDWFGPRFVRLVSQFIINAAILSEQKGYVVSKEEAMADLIRNTEISYKQNKDNPNLAVTTPQEYFNEQLRRLNMDKAGAVRTWRQVMLFRRYFQDVGNSVLVDTLSFDKFNGFAKESVNVDLYRLPPELQLNDAESLQKFEVYLNAVAKRSKDDLITLPTTFLSVNEVAKTYPELVNKRYLLEVSQAGKKSLQGRITLKDIWNWQVNDQNWANLKKQFPDLGSKKDSTRDERFTALDNLDSVTRTQVDALAKSALVDSHPEWIAEALDRAQPDVQAVGLRTEGGKSFFDGLTSREKRAELIALLDRAPLNEAPDQDSKLYTFSPDGQTVYRIKVLGRDSEPTILTFAEVYKDGTLNTLINRLLEKYYVTARDKTPSLYQNEDKSWKKFESVRSVVANEYADKVLNINALVKAIQKTQVASKAEPLTKDQAAPLRLFAHVSSLKGKLEKNPEDADTFVRTRQVAPSKDALSKPEPLATQWQIEKAIHPVKRGSIDPSFDFSEAFELPEQAWSGVKTLPNGNITFFRVKGKDESVEKTVAFAEQVRRTHDVLSVEAQRALMRVVMKEIMAKKAISLSYLDQPIESGATSSEPASGQPTLDQSTLGQPDFSPGQ